MTRERVWLTQINTQNITANDNVENGNVVFVDFGRKAAAPTAIAA